MHTQGPLFVSSQLWLLPFWTWTAILFSCMSHKIYHQWSCLLQSCMLAVRYQEPSAVRACVCESNPRKTLRSQPRNKAAQSQGETPATAKGSWAAIVVSCISQQIYCRHGIWAASLFYRLLTSWNGCTVAIFSDECLVAITQGHQEFHEFSGGLHACAWPVGSDLMASPCQWVHKETPLIMEIFLSLLHQLEHL